MILSATILQLTLAFVFPIELEVDISTSGSDGEASICKLNNLLLYDRVINAGKFRVELKVCNRREKGSGYSG